MAVYPLDNTPPVISAWPQMRAAPPNALATWTTNEASTSSGRTAPILRREPHRGRWHIVRRIVSRSRACGEHDLLLSRLVGRLRSGTRPPPGRRQSSGQPSRRCRLQSFVDTTADDFSLGTPIRDARGPDRRRRGDAEPTDGAEFLERRRAAGQAAFGCRRKRESSATVRSAEQWMGETGRALHPGAVRSSSWRTSEPMRSSTRASLRTSTCGEAWAIFSTMQPRTRSGHGRDQRVHRSRHQHAAGGSLIGGASVPIDWNVNDVAYFIDGTEVCAAHRVDHPQMQTLAASDFDEGGPIPSCSPWTGSGSPRTRPPGTFLSRVFDGGASVPPVNWSSLAWRRRAPRQTGSGHVGAHRLIRRQDGTWSAFTTVAASGDRSRRRSVRQYRAALSTTVPAATRISAVVTINVSSTPAGPQPQHRAGRGRR